MTESEWLACDDPRPMFGVVRHGVTERKMRLFALSCCRCIRGYPRTIAALENRIEDAVTEGDLQKALWDASCEAYGCLSYPGDTVGYADGAAATVFEYIRRGDWEEVTTAASQVVGYDTLTRSDNPELERLVTFWRMNRSGSDTLFRNAEDTLRRLPEYVSALGIERSNQADALRDIFGNPFQSVAFAAEWHTDTVTTLAQTMYDSRDFSAMPILADALQDAGCDNQDILNHCRDVNATHVRGCWVVDLVLGKE